MITLKNINIKIYIKQYRNDGNKTILMYMRVLNIYTYIFFIITLIKKCIHMCICMGL